MRAGSGWFRGRLRDARRRAALRLIAGVALTTGLFLGACAVKFGPSGEDSPDQSQRTPREQNQLYQQEQQRLEYQRQFDRVGPSDR